MKTMMTAMFLLTLAGSALAQGYGTPNVRPKNNGVCLDATHVDHTVVVNDQQILFYMRGDKIWLNTLEQPCSSLKFEGGFSEDVTGDAICSNMQMIRVMHSGATCSLGNFTPYTPPPPNAH